MSEKQKSPKLEFQTNVPVTLTPKKALLDGTNQRGPWYMWAVDVSGVGDHVCFVNDTANTVFTQRLKQKITVINTGKPSDIALQLVGAPVAPAAPQAPKPTGGYQDKGEGQIATPRASGGVQDYTSKSIEAQVALKVAGQIVAENPDKSLTETANEAMAWLDSVLRPEKTHRAPVEEDNIPYTPKPEGPPTF